MISQFNAYISLKLPPSVSLLNIPFFIKLPAVTGLTSFKVAAVRYSIHPL